MKRILVCEDEDSIRDFVVINLRRAGYDVVDVASGEEAVEEYKKQNGNFDVALLDIMMPGMDGFALCRWIREQSAEIGIIMLSAKSQEMDKINCLMTGADDYVTKPFSLKVLMHRIDTLLKRGTGIVRTDDSLSLDGILIKPSAHDVFLNGELLNLTLKEYKILTKLTSHLGRVYTREQLLDEVWGIEYAGDTRTVDSHVARLRTKLGEWGIKHIKTIYGTGYKAE